MSELFVNAGNRKSGRNDKMKKKRWAAAGAVLILLLAGIYLGNNDGAGTTELTAGAPEEQEEQEETTVTESPAEPETEAEPENCEVSTAEQAILDELWKCLEEGDEEGAARVLNDNDGQLQILFYTTMEVFDWRFDGQRLTDDLNGKGLVFRRPTSIYYGELKNGCPEGEGTMLQAVRVGAGRYDFAKGSWKRGKLEGEGVSGYRHYEEPEEEDLMEVVKEGVFQENLMDGMVTYTGVNKAGEDTRWQFAAAQGVTVLDESWEYLEDKGEYRLFSEGDDTHAYILPQAEMGAAIWKNQVTWD